MSGRILIRAIELAIAAQLVAASVAQGADYRGAASGWPAYANGYYAANYPANYGAGAAYYVARPVTAGYAAAPGAVTYVPARVAYANPTYYGAYGRSPAVYRPVSVAGYAPTAGGYAPTTAYYAPVTANYAPANSYAVQPAGMGSAGSEAAGYYQPGAVNYVPPQYNYRTTYAQVPVYMYRPVTTYDPIMAQPTTCMQPSTYNSCQQQRSRCSSILNPFSWFGSSSSCGSRGCGAPSSGCGSTNSCTTNYCGAPSGQGSCGQPYYPAQPMTPVVPVVPYQPVPSNVIPALPRGFIPSGGTTIPPPPTAPPGTRTIISPADAPPSLAPRPGSFGAPSSGTFTPLPGSSIPAQPAQPGFGTPAPSGSFPTAPAQPPTGFGTGSFGTGTNYAPAIDPYNATMTPVEKASGSAPQNSGATQSGNTTQGGPAHSVFGSGYRGSDSAESNVIRAPGSTRALPPSVQTVPDLDAPSARDLDAAGTPRPINAAPKLLDPRDKTARLGNRWAAVPAKWPEQGAGSKQLQNRPVTKMRAYEAQNVSGPMNSPYRNAVQANPADYDDKGWKTAAGY